MAELREKLLIDIRELSALIGIEIGTIYHWVSADRIPSVKLSQRCLRFSLPAIRAWLAELSEPALEDQSPRIHTPSIQKDTKSNCKIGGTHEGRNEKREASDLTQGAQTNTIELGQDPDCRKHTRRPTLRREGPGQGGAR